MVHPRHFSYQWEMIQRYPLNSLYMNWFLLINKYSTILSLANILLLYVCQGCLVCVPCDGTVQAHDTVVCSVKCDTSHHPLGEVMTHSSLRTILSCTTGLGAQRWVGLLTGHCHIWMMLMSIYLLIMWFHCITWQWSLLGSTGKNRLHGPIILLCNSLNFTSYLVMEWTVVLFALHLPVDYCLPGAHVILQSM